MGILDDYMKDYDPEQARRDRQLQQKALREVNGKPTLKKTGKADNRPVTAAAQTAGVDLTGYSQEQIDAANFELTRMVGRRLANSLMVTQRPEREGAVVEGGSIFDTSPEPDNIWGFGNSSLWVSGEGLMIAAPTGVGKTTLGGQVLAGLLGLTDTVLGMPVKEATRPILYLAMDRPTQIVRALARQGQLGNGDRKTLDERLILHKGPLDFSVNTHPEALHKYAKKFGAGVIIIDSVKDMLLNVSEEESGQAFNTAVQHCLASGIEVMAYHHVTKASKGDIADVYGSTWLTAGMGSVIGLHGKAGGDGVEFAHLKQPADMVYMGMLDRDDHAGTFTSGVARGRTVASGNPIMQLLRAIGSEGATVAEIAESLSRPEASVRTSLGRLGDAVESLKREGENVLRYRVTSDAGES